MWLIIALIIVAILLLVVELVLLPGISVAGICSLGAFMGATALTYIEYGMAWGTAVVTISVVLAIAAVFISLKSNTWRRLSLDSTIDSTSNTLPKESNIKIGDIGQSVTRLAPMGNILIAGVKVEAKSADVFIDQRQEVEVIGFENSVVIVQAKR